MLSLRLSHDIVIGIIWDTTLKRLGRPLHGWFTYYVGISRYRAQVLEVCFIHRLSQILRRASTVVKRHFIINQSLTLFWVWWTYKKPYSRSALVIFWYKTKKNKATLGRGCKIYWINRFKNSKKIIRLFRGYWFLASWGPSVASLGYSCTMRPLSSYL